MSILDRSPIAAARRALETNPDVVASAANAAQSTQGIVPAWKASTTYSAGQRVIAPSGDIVAAKAAFTSGATYSAANWNASAQDGRIGAVEAKNATQDADISNARSGALSDAKAYADATFIPGWKASTAYAAGQRVVAPNGDVVAAKAAHTSGASYTAANWNPSSQDGRIGAVEARTTAQPLGTSDLDTILTPGVYGQGSSGGATTALHYPENYRGALTVYLVNGTNIAQQYIATYTQNTYIRERSGGVWTAWKLQTPYGVIALGSADLDTIKAPGDYGQGTTGSATTANHYPIVGRGTLRVRQVSGTNVAQMYWATAERKMFVRECYGGVWTDWQELGAGSAAGFDPRLANAETSISVLNAEQDTQDNRLTTLEAQTGLSNPVTGVVANGDGTISFRLADTTLTAGVPVPASIPTDQVDYTQITARKSNTKTMQVKRTGTNGEVEVSCIGPDGHVTYKFAGAANDATAFDDYRVQRDVWVGAVVNGVPSKDKQLTPISNKEFAIQIAPVGQTPEWVPWHGTPSAFAAEPAVILNNGAPLDVMAMANGSTVAVDKFELVQHVYGRHTSQPGVNLIEIWTSHTVTPDGRMQVVGKWRALQDIVLGTNYVIMCPVAPTFDTVVSSLNNSYPHNAGMNGTNTYLPESDTAISYVFLNSADTSVGVAMTYRNIAETMRRGMPNKEDVGNRARLEHRTDGTLLKLYNTPWKIGTTVPAGTVHRFAGDYQYMQAPALYSLLAR